MKVKFKYGIQTYSGTLDEMTYGSYVNDSVCIGRKHVSPILTENNTLMGTTLQNLAAVYALVSAGYKADLKTYARRNRSNVPKGSIPPTSFALWVKMLYRFSELDSGHIDLLTLTLGDLQTVGEDIASISAAVENGYLAAVSGADELIANM